MVVQMALIPALRKAGRSQRLKSALSIERIPDQPGLCRHTISEKKKEGEINKLCAVIRLSIFACCGTVIFIHSLAQTVVITCEVYEEMLPITVVSELRLHFLPLVS